MSNRDWLEKARRCAVDRLLERAERSGRAPGFHRRHPHDKRSSDYRAELLERRLVLSVAAPIDTPPISVVQLGGAPVIKPGIVANISSPFQPSDIQTAYGISSISFSGVAGTGAGQTIAIIDAYNDPNIVSDAATFNTQFGLPQFNTAGNGTLTVLNQTGGTTLPANATSSNGGWDTEISLDVEWAHAVAPKANIVLFEANSAGGSDLYTAVATAAAYSGVSVVSMSFGSGEFSGESFYDSTFTTPSGHQGVTFLASTGDDSAPAEYPALSPNVVAVGGTSLVLGDGSAYSSETTWGNGTAGASGGGGGISSYESQPSFQAGNVNGLSSTKRTAPDVAMLADPNTGVYMYDSWAGGTGSGGYYIAGGTSLASPMWAGLVAIANQGRATIGLGTLDGPSQTLPRLYQLPSSDFHDITTGSNGFSAAVDYDLATGRGTPIANLLVPALAGVTQTASKLSFSVGPSSAAAGASISPTITVDVLDSFGDVAISDNSSVSIAFGNNADGGTLGGTLTVTAANGVATFTGLSINKAAAGYTLTATDGSLSSATSGSFTISAASASQLVITHQPSASTVGVVISPAVAVTVEDAFDNVVTANGSTITLTLSSGGSFTAGGTTVTAVASSGVATFSNLNIATAGSFTLGASDGALNTASTNSFTIAKATPNVGVTDGGGTYNGVAFAATAASANDPTSGATLASFGSGLLSYGYYAGTLTTALQVSGAMPLGFAPTAAGAYTAVATYAGTANYNSAGSLPVNFSVAKRTLHVTATGQNKTYDGTTTAMVTLFDDRVAGDTLSIADGSAVFADKNVNDAIAISVSGITVSGAAAGNYTLAATTAGTSANMTALALTGSFTGGNKTYDDTTNATIATRTLSGVLSGDTVSMIGGTAIFNSKDVTSATTVTAIGFTLSGAQAGDYSLSNPTQTASASISALSIAGSITAGSKTYDDTTAATIATRSLAGVLGSDAVTLIGGSASFDSQDVASATMVTASGLSLSGAQAGDYSLNNPTETAAAVITPLSITGSITANSKTYDGTVAATLSSRTLSGVLGDDNVMLAGGTATFNSKDVTTATMVIVTGLALSGAEAGDYSLGNPTESAPASISPLAISASIVANNKVYDGTTSAIVMRSLPGVISGDSVSLVPGLATFNSADVASANSVTTISSLTGAQSTDYSLSNPTETVSASITPLPITVNITAADKTYDGSTAAVLTGETLSGVLNSDDVTVGGGAATFNTKDAGVNKTVTASGLVLSGTQAGDYSLANPNPTTTASISPLAITGSFVANNKTYDGTLTASIFSATLQGTISGDNVAVSTTPATFAGKDVGNGITVSVSGLSLHGAQAGDYTLGNPSETTTANIMPLTISPSVTASSKTYDQTTAATITTRNLSGVKSGDEVSLAGGVASFNSAQVNNANTVTVTALSLSGPQARDYMLASTTARATAHITPLPITGSITAGDKVYDATTAATITGGTLSGVLSGDLVTLTGGSATFATKDVGVNKIAAAGNLTLGSAQASDYSLANPTETATASIVPLTITGAISANNKTYDGTIAATLSAQTLAGVYAGDVVTLDGGSAAFNSADVSSASMVTATGLSISGPQAGNYILGNTTESTPASITALAVSGSITVSDKLFDGTTAATISSRTLEGEIGGDDVSLAGGSASFASSIVGNNKLVTATGLTLAGSKAADYALANATETTAASIAPLAISGTVFNDTSIDGTHQNSEAGLSGRTVTLQIAGKGTKGQKTTKTDVNGNFAFSNLAVGNYVVKVTPPLHWRNTNAVGNGEAIALQPGQAVTSLQFGQSDDATVAGSVFLDANRDRKKQAREAGLAGWTVTLTAAGSNSATFTTTTNASGNYVFPAVPVGNYQLSIVETAGYSQTPRAKSSYTLTLTAGKAVTGENFGQQLGAGVLKKAGKRRRVA